MRTLVITLLGLATTCAYSHETCNVRFINTANSQQEMTVMQGKNMNMISNFGTIVMFNNFMVNDPQNVDFEFRDDTNGVFNFGGSGRSNNPHQNMIIVDLGNRADFRIKNGRLYDYSFPNNGWMLFARKQPSSSDEYEYIAQTGGKEVLFNVFKSSGRYHHMFKHTNGNISVVKQDCSVTTYSGRDAEYEAIWSILEELILTSGWELVRDT